MAQQPMADAVSGEVAQSAEYNKLIDNIQDLDARLGPVVSTASAGSRLTTLETRTTDASTGNAALGTRTSTLETNQGTRGSRDTVYAEIQNLRNVTLNSTSGNQAIYNSLGTGLGTTTDGTTGTATAQLSSLRTRVAAVESATGAGAAIGGEWKASAVQNLSGASNKLVFGAVNIAANGVGWNGSDTLTIQTEGVYSFFVNLRINASNSVGGCAISGTTYNDGTMILPPTPANSAWGDFSFSGTVWLPAGQQICAWFYLNSPSTAATAFSIRPPMFKCWKTA